MLPSLGLQYLIIALEGTPEVLQTLLGDLETNDSKWDFRPDPDRFTLREIVTHLVSIEPHWAQRAIRTRDEHQPFFARVSLPDENAVLNTPSVNLNLLRENRLQFVNVLKSLSEENWERLAQSELVGPMTLEQQAVFVLAHDGYHINQVTQWLKQAH